jgi:hypothetical protein
MAIDKPTGPEQTPEPVAKISEEEITLSELDELSGGRPLAIRPHFADSSNDKAGTSDTGATGGTG